MLLTRPLLIGGTMFLAIPSLLVRKPLVQANTPPVVQIVSPGNDAGFAAGALVTYSVTVSDKEDGESKFEEIPPAEIFIELHYFADPARAAVFRKSTAKEPGGYSLVKKSDCFNCHTAHAKLIGPSFADIAAKYKKTPDLVTLAAHITKGSAGIWGTAPMPTHADISDRQGKEIIQWILGAGGDPNADYLRGAEGAFRLFNPPKPAVKGVYVMKATYTDHGLAQTPGTSLTGQDTRMLRTTH